MTTVTSFVKSSTPVVNNFTLGHGAYIALLKQVKNELGGDREKLDWTERFQCFLDVSRQVGYEFQSGVQAMLEAFQMHYLDTRSGKRPFVKCSGGYSHIIVFHGKEKREVDVVVEQMMEIYGKWINSTGYFLAGRKDRVVKELMQELIEEAAEEFLDANPYEDVLETVLD